jgi:hypothetical protein
MDDLSSRFLAAWNEIDKTVKSIFPESRKDSFPFNVRGAAKMNATVRRFQETDGTE